MTRVPAYVRACFLNYVYEEIPKNNSVFNCKMCVGVCVYAVEFSYLLIGYSALWPLPQVYKSVLPSHLFSPPNMLSSSLLSSINRRHVLQPDVHCPCHRIRGLLSSPAQSSESKDGDPVSPSFLNLAFENWLVSELGRARPGPQDV